MSTWKERVPERTYVDEYPTEALSPRRKSVYGSQKSVSKSSTSAAAPGDDPVRIARTLMTSRTPRRPSIFPPPRRGATALAPLRDGNGGTPYEDAARRAVGIDHCRCPFQLECSIVV